MKNKEKYDLSKLILEDETSINGKIVYMAVYEKDTSDRTRLFEKKYTTQPTYPYHLLVDFANWLEEEYKPNILDDVEKAYLSAVIKPFRKRIKYIEKIGYSSVNNDQFLCIALADDRCGLPNFKKGTMYKGMRTGKRYTLEELGLWVTESH